MCAILVFVGGMAFLASRNVLIALIAAAVFELPRVLGAAYLTNYAAILGQLSPFGKLSGFLSGILDIESLVYYFTGAVLMVAVASCSVLRPNGGLRRSGK